MELVVVILVFAVILLALLTGTVVWLVKRDSPKQTEALLGVVHPQDDTRHDPS